jgi:hypothetical protein
VAVALLLVSIPGIAQVQPAAGGGKVSLPMNFSVGAGMDYWSGDYGGAKINRWGPAAWVTASIWHCLGINVEGHSMILGGNSNASNYKLFVGEGGLMCTMGYWGRFQPIYKGEMGFASLTQPATVQAIFIPTTGRGLSEAAWNTTFEDIGGRAWIIPMKPSRTFTAPPLSRTTL